MRSSWPDLSYPRCKIWIDFDFFLEISRIPQVAISVCQLLKVDASKVKQNDAISRARLTAIHVIVILVK